MRCGMVKNVGESRKYTFLAYNADNTVSLQFLESSQIDMNNRKRKRYFEKETRLLIRLIWYVQSANYKGNNSTC